MNDWDDLRFFLAAARHGSSRAAARALGVNQSTMSRRLSQFEDDHGVRLFERRARGLALTAAGAEIVDAAADIEARFNALERQILGRDTRLSGTIRLSIPDFILARLAPIVADFGRAYPEIRTEFMVGSAVLNLSKREADVVVRLSVDPPLHLVGRRLADTTGAVYASRRYVRAHAQLQHRCADAQPLTTAELAALDWLRWGEPWQRLPTERWIQDHVPAANVRAVVNSNLAMLELLYGALGVSFQLCTIADEDQALVRIGQPLDFGMSIWLLTHEDIRRTARISAFMKFVGDAMAAHRPRPQAPAANLPSELA